MQPHNPIQHVVIIVKENHSFDNYFGSFPGANGTTLPPAQDPPAGGELNNTTRTVEFTFDALSIAQRTGDLRAEGDDLSLLGWYHAKLGKIAEATD